MRPEGTKTVGSMDLGGASTQIAFAVQDDLMGLDYMHIKLYGYPYNVYTHSFLCYGKNEAEKMVLDKVVQVRSFSSGLICMCVCACTEVSVSINKGQLSQALTSGLWFFYDLAPCTEYVSCLNAYVWCKCVLFLHTCAV